MAIICETQEDGVCLLVVAYGVTAPKLWLKVTESHTQTHTYTNVRCTAKVHPGIQSLPCTLLRKRRRAN